MTTSEAIAKVLRVKWQYSYESDYEALDMAVEALRRMKSAVWMGWTKSYYKGRDDDDEPIWGECTYYICSNCGRRTVVADPFCPSCGASMEKEM